MSIRAATQEDVPLILDLGEQLHRESPRWSRIPFVRERAETMIRGLIAIDDGVVFVAEVDGQVVGGIAGVIEQHWASTARVAHEVSFFMDREHRGGFSACRLICALRAWGEIRGAAWLHVGTSTGVDPEMTARLYEKLGFERCSIGLEAIYHGH